MISSYFNAFQDGQLAPSSTHFWLLGAAIFGSLVVAAGIMLEANWPLSRMKFREIVGVTFVLFGVCVEALFTIALFVFDEGISRSQQTTISKQQETIISFDAAEQSLTEEEDKTKLAVGAANERAASLERDAEDAKAKIADANLRAATAEKDAAIARLELVNSKPQERLMTHNVRPSAANL